MLQVRDGSRIIQFDGELLAHSSSKRPGSYRWVQFDLYKTASGLYVLAREGVSKIYHTPGCVVIKRNSLSDSPRSELAVDAYPCELCRPDESDFPMVFVEKSRFWAQVCETPVAVLDALYKYDDAGSRYLTLVAQRLLDTASEVDTRIADVYRVETIS
jgi:hypothetical protein